MQTFFLALSILFLCIFGFGPCTTHISGKDFVNHQVCADFDFTVPTLHTSGGISAAHFSVICECHIFNFSQLACTAGSLLTIFFNFLAIVCGWLRVRQLQIPTLINFSFCTTGQRTSSNRFIIRHDCTRLEQTGPNSNCKSGPKSGHSTSKPSSSLICALAFIAFNVCGALLLMDYSDLSGGEGCLDQSWIQTEADFNATTLYRLLQAKNHDKALPMDFGPERDSLTVHRMGSVQKRSYKRAFRRALRTGSAWYRGQCLTLEQFSPGLHRPEPDPAQPRSRQRPQKPMAPRHRVQVGHVNVGGLSQDRLHEIKIWAQETEIDIMLLSETRWSFDAEWVDAHWYHIHSGTDKDRADGLLFLVRKTFCKSEHLGFAAVLPGRIGHLRIQFSKRSLDLIGCYQYTANPTNYSTQKRQGFWNQLEQVAATVPNRNNIIYLGDFNCGITAQGPYTGTEWYTWQSHLCKGPVHKDRHEFMEFLQKFHLTVLNSWNAKNPPSFVNILATSNIDHIIMRLADVDSAAKDVKYFPNAPFLPIAGAKHIPMTCTIRKIPYAYTKQAQLQVCSFQQRMKCRRAWQSNSNEWQQFHNSFTNRFFEFTQLKHDDQTLVDDLHNWLLPVFHHHFPVDRPSCHPLSEPDASQVQTIRLKWHHRAQLVQCQTTDVQSLFHAWFHFGRFRKLKRLQQQRVRLLKKQKLHDLLSDVAQASHRHDSFAVYQAIRKYTPKQPLKRIRLRRPDGTPATNEQALDMTREHIQEIWHRASQIELQPPVPVGVPFTCDELIQEFAQIPLTKAVGSCTTRFNFYLCQITTMVESTSHFHTPTMEGCTSYLHQQTVQNTRPIGPS